MAVEGLGTRKVPKSDVYHVFTALYFVYPVLTRIDDETESVSLADTPITRED